MKQYNIGLDFGTYQSKACVYNLRSGEHEFFTFPNGTFFLPSKVFLRDDGKLEYGNTKSGKIKEVYSYFKIASAEDKEFHVETYDQNYLDSNFYQFNEFRNYTPEFLSAVYLTYVLFLVKEKYQLRQQVRAGFNKLLSKLQRQDNLKEIRFTIRLGIPTEWSQQKNQERQRKFESILILSELLQKKYKEVSSFLNVSAEQLVLDVRNIQKEELKFTNKKKFFDKLNDLGISLCPETAAGLTFIIKTRQLQPGYYAAMDIGGGSTDVSFFIITQDQKIRYFASESYLIAANNVYMQLAVNAKTLRGLQDSEIEVRRMVSNPNNGRNDLKMTLNKINGELERVISKLFVQRVHYAGIIPNYKDQPIIVYGGGSLLPVLGEGRLKIFDNGVRTNRNGIVDENIRSYWTFLNKTGLKRFSSILNILPSNKTWEKDLSLLSVALGLSFIHSPGDADWFSDESYRSTNAKSNDMNDPNLTPHPFNEGYFIYNVLARRFD